LEWLIEQGALERAAARDLLEKASQIWKTDLTQLGAPFSMQAISFAMN
jgi:hypothetical protein